MKLSSQEEYGLRCLLHVAQQGERGSLTIPEVSEAVGISPHYAAKLMRILRRGGFVKSARGQVGGYTLARSAHEIVVGEVLAALGGRLFDPLFCNEHAGVVQVCTRSIDCSLRSLWRAVQLVVDRVLSRTTIAELLATEQQVSTHVSQLVTVPEDSLRPPEPAGRL
jgi:Rrf2 family protein